MNDLAHLADLIRIQNFLNGSISRILDRPATTGAIGEFIAAEIFDIELHANSVMKASDGYFTHGDLAGKSVNIKFYSKSGGLLDMSTSELHEEHATYYLVLAGPKPNAYLVKGTSSPLAIQYVYLFETAKLMAVLTKPDKPLRTGIATSVRKAIWEAAMIYPQQVNQDLIVSDEQRAALELFAPV